MHHHRPFSAAAGRQLRSISAAVWQRHPGAVVARATRAAQRGSSSISTSSSSSSSSSRTTRSTDLPHTAAGAPDRSTDPPHAAAGAPDSSGAQHSTPLSQLVPVPTPDDLAWPDCPFKLRPYQIAAIQAVLREWKGGLTGQMVMLPTGTGKTVVFSALTRYLAQHHQQPTTPDTEGQAAAAAATAQVAPAAAAAAAAEAINGDVAASSSEPAVASSRYRSRRVRGRPRQGSSSEDDDDDDSSSSSRGGGGGVVVAAAHPAAAASSSGSTLTGSTSSSQPEQQPPGQQQPTCPSDAMRVLVLAHRHELLVQAHDKFRLVWGRDVSVSYVKGPRKEFFGQVVLASVATAVNCVERLAALNFSVVIVDEAHHSIANTYTQVLAGLGLLEEVPPPPVSSTTSSRSSLDASSSSSSSDEDDEENSDGSRPPARRFRPRPNPHQLLLGFSATPYRMRIKESKQLYNLFSVTYFADIREMIKARALCEVQSRKILTTTDLRGAGGSANQDFVLSRLSKLVNSRSRNKLVLQAYLEACTAPAAGSSSSSSSRRSSSFAGRVATRKAIAFAVDIAHAEELNAVFQAAGVPSGCVHSKMPPDVTQRELAAFRAGHTCVLFNVEQLTEGFDEPSIDAVLLARPTRSLGLYTQMLGRGLRLLPGKRDCLVLDFTDMLHRAGQVIDLRTLLPEFIMQLPDDQELPQRGPSRIEDESLGGDVDVLDEAEQFNPALLAWWRNGPHWVASMFQAGSIWMVSTAGMGVQQRARLGLAAEGAQPANGSSSSGASNSAGSSSSSRRSRRRRAGSDDDDDDDDAERNAASEQERFVVLFQPHKEDDPANWQPVAPNAGGLTMQDAYGVVVDFVPTVVRQQQALAVRSHRAGYKQRTPYKLAAFLSMAPWRSKPASEAQLKVMADKGLMGDGDTDLSSGEAAERLSRHFLRLGGEAQRAQLQALLGPGEALPVPLLHTHADRLLQARSTQPGPT